jgi:hypothetical protein
MPGPRVVIPKTVHDIKRDDREAVMIVHHPLAASRAREPLGQRFLGAAHHDPAETTT